MTVSSVVIIGASGAGKTTLLNALKGSALAERLGLCFPKRYVTRPVRDNDDLSENHHVDVASFDAMVEAGAMAAHWRRVIGPDRIEQYGFALKDVPAANSVPVYSCNNAMLAPAALLLPRGFLSDALIVAVRADERERERRLLTRSPLMMRDLEEARHRVGDPDRAVLRLAHLVIDTGGENDWRERAVERIGLAIDPSLTTLPIARLLEQLRVARSLEAA